MTENPKLDEIMMDKCECGEILQGKESRKISVSDDVNELQHSTTKSDSFVVDMERFSQLIQKDVSANSRITLQRNLSRKGTLRGGDKKFNPTIANERDCMATSPIAPSHGGISKSEKAVVLPLGAIPQVHHQITITNCSESNATDTKAGGRRFIFRRSSLSLSFDPRRIFFFFATLSSMGTLLLIYFTITIGKLNGDGNAYD